MGKRLTASEETALLLDTIRQAHEATQALWDAVKAARMLQPDLIEKFQAIAENEIRQLSNHLQNCSNKAAAELNASVTVARQEIINQLAVAELVLDKQDNTARLLFNAGTFATDTPLPYPHQSVKENQS